MFSTDDTTAGVEVNQLDLKRMSHRDDPVTSHLAAERASRGRKKFLIQAAIVQILAEEPRTCSETFDAYDNLRADAGWPKADLLDIRRRMSELKKHLHRVIDTDERRNGEAVMANAEAVAA